MLKLWWLCLLMFGRMSWALFNLTLFAEQNTCKDIIIHSFIHLNDWNIGILDRFTVYLEPIQRTLEFAFSFHSAKLWPCYEKLLNCLDIKKIIIVVWCCLPLHCCFVTLRDLVIIYYTACRFRSIRNTCRKCLKMFRTK